MTLGSLFDGSGAFPFAGLICGLKPLWASEIETFPVNVTKARLPKMQHLGDIRHINGACITPVDVITFGSPCQDLSVAGKRAGLDGERSGLFTEAIRIIKEMRAKTNGKYPRYAVWENVPGALSSNKGEDFRVVLEEFCKVCAPEVTIPQSNVGGSKWSTAGNIVGNGYSIAWRVLDAQYWGVPQRRRRIFLVADFRGGSAAQILFEREGLPRNFAESREAWHGIEPNSTYSSYTAGKCWDARGNGNGDIAPTITGDHNNRVSDYSAVVVLGVDKRNQSTGNKAHCVHQGGEGVPCIVFNLLQDPISAKNKAPCLSTGNNREGQAALGVVYSIDRAAFNQGANAKYTSRIDDNGVAQTLVARGPGAVCVPTPQAINGNVAGTLDAGYYRGCGNRSGKEREVVAQYLEQQWIVRRLTPKECGRLMGMPDWWCADVPHKDAAEYKMWGNGVALPCVIYVLYGIAQALLKSITEVIA